MNIETATIAVFVLVPPILLLNLFAHIRGEWIAKELFKIIDRSHDEFLEYPDYWLMLAKFWVWDIREFRAREG